MGNSSLAKTPKINLSKYVNIGGDQWRFCQVVVSANGRMRQKKRAVRQLRFAAGEFAGDRGVSGCDVGVRDPGAHSFGQRTNYGVLGSGQDEHLLCARFQTQLKV